MSRTTPPAGQVTSGWLLVERIDGTRSWNVKCVECGGVSVASSITVGKSLGLGRGMLACDTCDVIGRKVADRMFDLETIVERDAEILDLLAGGDDEQTEHDAVGVGAGPGDDRMLDVDGMPGMPAGLETAAQSARRIILARMAGSARSAQAAPGPSEIGGCERRLAHRMVFGAKDRREDASAWRPQVGTFGHAGLAGWFSAEDDWLTDVRVASPIAGTLDAFHVPTGQVLDFKFVGITTLKAARKGQISDKYVTQLALYGLGMVQAGHAVKTLALWFLPSAGSLDDAHYEEWPYDERVAWAAVAKRDRIQACISEARADGSDPASLLPLMSTTEDYCRSCPALGAHCSGAKGDVKPGSLGIELVR